MKKRLFVRLFLIGICVIFQQVVAQSQVETAFPSLFFTSPVDIQNAGDGTDRLFVVEQNGVIRVFPNDPATDSAPVFLNIISRVDDSDNEQGLLGLAFHPDYENNGYFFVNYTMDPGPGLDRTRISRFKVSDSDPNVAEPDSELVLLEFEQDFGNHNGGAIAFGPDDGYLYIAVGDGGSGGDPNNRAQNLRNLLGSILRIDVDNSSPDANYAIPEDNPYAGNSDGFREEIYAPGMRNPWRISFDPETGRLWAGDVGQNALEEIDIIENGKNYGWRIMEGTDCFNPSNNCNQTGLELPVWEYGRSLGRSITGGYVYRGAGVPEFTGQYIYADFVTGRIWALDVSNINSPVNTQVQNTNLNISTFGIDEQNELYIAAFDGRIYRFTPTATGIADDNAALPAKFALDQNYPNPFNPSTIMPFSLPAQAAVNISVFDLNGKLIRTIVDKTVPAGQHTAYWNGRSQDGLAQPSGIYFYTLKIDGNLIDTRQMMLLK